MSNYICKIRYVYYSNTKLLQTQNMTTIAEFLNRTSGNNSYGELYKEGAVDVPGTINAATGFIGDIAEQGWNGLKQLGKDVYNTYNPTDEGARQLLNDHLTWDIYNNTAQTMLNQNQFKPFASTYNSFIGDEKNKNEDARNALLQSTRDAIFNEYRPANGQWTPQVIKQMQADFANPNKINWRPGLQDKIMAGNMNVMLNDDNALYSTVYNSLPENDDNRNALNNTIANNPDRLKVFSTTVKPLIQKAITDDNGNFNFQRLQEKAENGLTGQENLINSVTRAISPLVKDYLLQDTDDDYSVTEGTEEEGLTQDTYGNDARYSGMFHNYYDPKNPTDSRKALLGVYHQFRRPELGVKMVDHISDLKPEEAKNSGIGRFLGYMANVKARAGKQKGAQRLINLRESLAEMIGQKDSRAWDSATIYDYMISEMDKAENDDNIDEALGDSQFYQETKNIDPYAQTDDILRVSDQEAKLKALAQEIRNNPWESGYYGFLKDPNIRRAVQYAAPWLMYGLPLAGIGSMLGTNSLWPLVLFGGLGSSVLGYGSGKWNWFQPETLEKMDNFFGKVNNPISYLSSMILPEQTSNTINNFLSTPANKRVTYTPYEFMTPEEQEEYLLNGGTPTAYNVPRFNSTGTAYTTPEDASRNSNYYVSRQNNPMAVGSMRLG